MCRSCMSDTAHMEDRNLWEGRPVCIFCNRLVGIQLGLAQLGMCLCEPCSCHSFARSSRLVLGRGLEGPVEEGVVALAHCRCLGTLSPHRKTHPLGTRSRMDRFENIRTRRLSQPSKHLGNTGYQNAMFRFGMSGICTGLHLYRTFHRHNIYQVFRKSSAMDQSKLWTRELGLYLNSTQRQLLHTLTLSHNHLQALLW